MSKRLNCWGKLMGLRRDRAERAEKGDSFGCTFFFLALSGYYEAGWAETSIALAHAARGLAGARREE